MSDVYRDTLGFFARKCAREFRPAWLRAAPNLALHRALMIAEGRGWIAPRLQHRWLKPVSVALQLTRHCNYRCEFCTVNELVSDGDGSNALTVAEFDRLLENPLLSGCARLSLTGGEPMLAPDVFRIIALAKKRIPIVTMNSNFSLIKLHLDTLNRSGLDMLNISLYEPNEKLVRRYAGELAPGIYRRLSFVVNTVDDFHSIERIPDVVELALQSGFRALYLQNVLEPTAMDHGTPRLQNAERVRPIDAADRRLSEIRRQVESSARGHLAIAWPSLGVRSDGPRRCRQPDTQIMIDRDGILAPCCILDPHRDFGSVWDAENWNSPGFVDVRRGLKCQGEAIAPACEGCPFLSLDMFDA